MFALISQALVPARWRASIRAAYGSLGFRLTLWNTAVVLLAVLSSMFAVRAGVRVALMRETDNYLLDDAAEIVLAVQEFYPDQQRIFEELDRKAAGHAHRGLFVQWLDAKGNVVHSSVHTPRFAAPPRFPRGDSALASAGGFRIAQRKLVRPAGYVIRAGQSLKPVNEDVDRLTKTMVVVATITVLLSPLGGYWLARRVTRPLAYIGRLAASARPSKLHERLPIRHTGDELDRLSQTINGLLDRIAAYLDQNRQFIASAAHELRSPLTAIQSSVEVTLNAKRSPEEYQDLLGEIAQECSNLRYLVNQLLLLAESDAGLPKEAFETVSLERIVARSVEMFRDAAEEQGVRLQIGLLDQARVHGNQAHMRQLINNLIDNGLKFNPAGGRVLVELLSDAERREVHLRVSDSGPGISPQDLPHIFKRFYRGDKSRQRESATCGSGLGLSICQAIVEAHGGTIDVCSAPGQGATFDVRLPMSGHHPARSQPDESGTLVPAGREPVGP